MRKIVEDRDFGKLPDSMRIAGEEAYETLLHTGDGQLCDVIIDRAALGAIYQAGKESPDKIIQDYAESTVAVGGHQDRCPVTEDRKINRLYETGNGGM